MKTYTWDAVLSHVARRIGEASGGAVDASELVPPPNPDLGDIAFGCFRLAKAQKKAPADVAKDLVEKFKNGDQTIASVAAAGPYLNVTLKAGEFIFRVVQDVEHFAASYGASDDGAGKTLLLEYAQPNTHKEVHVGHLRNLALGASLAKILKRNGWNVVTASYHGDVGAHVAKCLWLLVRHASSVLPQSEEKKGKKKSKTTELLKMDPEAWTDHVLKHLDVAMAKKMLESIPKQERTGKQLGHLYAEATKLLEENPNWKTEVSEVQKKLEARDAAWDAVWQETRRWSIDEFKRIFEDLGVIIDRQYFESEVVDQGQRMVDDLLKKKVARQSQGAIVVDLEEDKLGVFLIRKSDGTSLYATKDLALAFLKHAEYPALERSLILVDNRQALYFRQLFRTLQLMGLKEAHEFVGYEFVTLTSGAMSSREGNIVTYQSFRDEVLNFARGETVGRHSDWPEGKIEHTAWCLAMGGVKYGMLKQDSDKMYVFDLERALSFDGDTGPYIQYAATRLGSILKKAGWNPKKGITTGDPGALVEPAERRLALQLALFPRVVRRAGAELKPAGIAQWCFATAQRVNDFYRDVPVLEAASVEQRAARLRLVASALSALLLGLDLLGIPLPEEM